MPTKAQLEKWIPSAVTDFQSVMPPINTPYPPTCRKINYYTDWKCKRCELLFLRCLPLLL